MAKYMLLLGGVDLDKRASAELAARTFERFTTWRKELQEKGHFVTSYRLRDQTGARLTVRGGQVVEGPFMETKEAVGGVLLLEASSLEEATALARGCPIFDVNGAVEVRLVDDGRPGRA
jgi:hypothetical protein